MSKKELVARIGKAELDLSELSTRIGAVVDEYVAEVGVKPCPAGSRALQFAIEAGLERKAFYTVAETARYLGVDRRLLDREHADGRLRYVMPRCRERAYVYVDDVDRWIEECSE